MKIKNNIPNFITLLNLFCGCLAIVAAFKSNLVLASYLVFAAAFFDYLDGTAARILKAHSEIGKQLDSLADMVSFGVVPAIIAFQLLNQYAADVPLFVNFRFILYTPFLIALFSALRLAKFNIDDRQTISFLGLPTPANAIFWASAPMIIEYASPGSFHFLQLFIATLFTNPYVLLGLSIVLSVLLVVELPLFSLKFTDFKWKHDKVRILFLICSFILLIIFNMAALPVIIVLYIVFSIIHQYLL